eukprot:SAG31_NODE_5280_length_2635_cov_2.574921_4_plen_44_part_00
MLVQFTSDGSVTLVATANTIVARCVQDRLAQVTRDGFQAIWFW